MVRKILLQDWTVNKFPKQYIFIKMNANCDSISDAGIIELAMIETIKKRLLINFYQWMIESS